MSATAVTDSGALVDFFRWHTLSMLRGAHHTFQACANKRSRYVSCMQFSSPCPRAAARVVVVQLTAFAPVLRLPSYGRAFNFWHVTSSGCVWVYNVFWCRSSLWAPVQLVNAAPPSASRLLAVHCHENFICGRVQVRCYKRRQSFLNSADHSGTGGLHSDLTSSSSTSSRRRNNEEINSSCRINNSNNHLNNTNINPVRAGISVTLLAQLKQRVSLLSTSQLSQRLRVSS
eukprot:3640990-Pleurochrysis_carterae.AAC.11